MGTLSGHRHVAYARSALARAGRVAGLCVWLAGCQASVLDPAGPVGVAEKTILLDSLAIMLAIVIPTILATLAFAWWFRASNTRARYLPEWAYSGRLEMITWSIPLLVIMFLGGMTWIGAHDLDPYKKLKSAAAPLEIQVVALDWKWLFIYPAQEIAAINQLVIPAGTPVHFSLTSASVLNTFFVPQLGSMIYTMNGMSVQLNLQADKPGSYYGESGQFSGDGFSDMHFAVRAVSTGEFDAWVQHAGAAGPMLDSASYAALSQQSTRQLPSTYRAVEPGLYDMIVARKLPPGPGPETGRGGPDVAPRTEPTHVR